MIKKIVLVIMIFISIFLLQQSFHKEPEDKYFLIGVSQPNLQEPWRIKMNEEIKKEAEKYDNIRVIFTDGAKNTNKQEADLKKLLDYGVDLLIVSMNDSERLTPVVSDIYKELPVIVLDRDVIGYDYNIFIGLDNYNIGKKAGELLYSSIGKSNINVVEIKGSADSLPTIERSRGFSDGIKGYDNIHVVNTIKGDWEKDKAEDKFKEILASNIKVDAVYAHSDDMAYGAYLASESLGKDIFIIGIDGLQGDNGGIELVKNGVIDATYTCKTGGKEAIQYAVDILDGSFSIPKKVILRSHEITNKNVGAYSTEEKKVKNKDKTIRLGFAQVGSESSWRVANTESIKDAAKYEGIDLVFKNVDNYLSDKEKQKQQKENIRYFIKEMVDVIAFSPIIETGWDDVLNEAKEAGIFVILSDREVDSNSELWTCYMGSDFVEEGRRAARWLIRETADRTEKLNIIMLEGNIGAAPSIGRKQGFIDTITPHENLDIIASVVGNFEYDEGKVIMDKYLDSNTDVDVIFAHNDDMALGAIESIENHGLVAGKDIIVISVDATKEAFKAMTIGKLNCSVECSPLLGPQMMSVVKSLMEGKELPIKIITEESVFTTENANEEMGSRKY